MFAYYHNRLPHSSHNARSRRVASDSYATSQMRATWSSPFPPSSLLAGPATRSRADRRRRPLSYRPLLQMQVQKASSRR
eukprot:1150627-Prymnesium_polylepis.1